MVGAMTIHGIVPGPQVMEKQPELFWGMIASMWLGNLMLVVISLPLVGLACCGYRTGCFIRRSSWFAASAFTRSKVLRPM